MATLISPSAPINNSDATFRAWTKIFRDNILAVGWTQTADTGQINFATVTFPALANTMQGYIIMAMADALQAAYPCYLKISFGSAPGANTRPGLQFSIGTGTDGAGTLTGNVTAVTQIQIASESATAINSYFSGSTSRLTIAQWAFSATFQVIINVERSVDSSGVDTNTGIGGRITWGSGTLVAQQFIPNIGLGAGPAAEAKFLCFGSLTNAISAGQNLSSISGMQQAYGPLQNAELGFMVYQSQFPSGAPVTLSRYGSDRVYFTCSAQLNALTFSYGLAANLLMLWE